MKKPQYGDRPMAVPKRYEHIDFKPPKTVADQAKKGLDYRKKGGKGGLSSQEAGKEGIGSGVQRAVNLKNRNNLTPETIKMMRGFFARHEKNKSIAPKNKDTPWKDAGHVAWLLWGGDVGKKWVDKIIGQMEKADKKEEQEKASKKAHRSLVGGENVPNNEKLWEKVQKLTKGEIKTLTHNGKTVNGPNDGTGFTKFPSAYANGFASKVYKDLGGTWSKKKKAGKQVLTPKVIGDLHKETLTFVSNIKKERVDYDNIGEFMGALDAFREKLSNLNLSLMELDSELTDKLSDLLSSEQGDMTSRERVSLAQEGLTFSKRKYFQPMINQILQLPSAKRYEAQTKESVFPLLLQKGYTEEQVTNYLQNNSLPTQEELDNKSMDEWYKEAKSWVRKTERLSREMKNNLLNYQAFLEREQEKLGISLVLHKSTVESAQIEGFQLKMHDFGGDPVVSERLGALNKALKIFKTNAKARCPIMLKRMVPFNVYWEGIGLPSIARGSGVAGLYFPRNQVITITPYGLLQDPRKLAHVIAHEMGHHLYRHFSKDQKTFWDLAMFEDYKGKLSIQYLLDLMDEHRIRNLYSTRWMQVDPIVYIQVQTIAYGSSNALSSRSDLEQALLDGQTHIRVPKNPITGYAATNHEEAFCEALGMFVAYGPRTVLPLVVKWLSTLIGINKRGSEISKATKVAQQYIARGKAKKDVGQGGLDEWFSGHGQGKDKSEGDATWGDWVAISPIKKTITKDNGDKKTYEPGDIIGPCGELSDDPNWKKETNNGKSPFKCMPRDKAHDMKKKERAELAKEKQKAEKGSRGKKPVNTPTFKKEKKAMLIRRVVSRYLK